VAEQNPDLIQFAAREVPETGAGAPQVVRASLSIPARAAAARTTSQSTFGGMPSRQLRRSSSLRRITGPIFVPEVSNSTAARSPNVVPASINCGA